MRTSAGGKRNLVIITPRAAATNAGNWHTAARWARFLRRRFRVAIASHWNGSDTDCLIALHARRSAASIAAFAAAHPAKPLIVVLTGTDLYRDLATDREAKKSLEHATHLVVLNDLGLHQVPRAMRSKARVIVQSARTLTRARRRRRAFHVAVVGHLREEKDPALVWSMLDHVDPALPLRVVHVGAAYEPALGRIARAVARRDVRYRWLGDLDRARARQVIRRADVLLHPSRMEGGAQVVIEAVTSRTPVIGSRIDGNTGLLGTDYPGWFAVGDARAAARLLERAARDRAFLHRLERACARRAPAFAPARESAAVNRLVDNALHRRTRKTR
jgi:putative glycosyltransferase (TIGR04348 family)